MEGKPQQRALALGNRPCPIGEIARTLYAATKPEQVKAGNSQPTLSKMRGHPKTVGSEQEVSHANPELAAKTLGCFWKN